MTITAQASLVASFILAVSLLATTLVRARDIVQSTPGPLVRLAELRIDPGQLEKYKAALREEIAASIRLEPGVLRLYAVSVKGDPEQIRIFEMYEDASAYEAHLQTPHFKKYKTGTQGMVKSLALVEADPILLGAKPN